KDEDIVYSFEVTFGRDSADFPEAQYGEHYQRALELASLYGNTIVSIRAHADPSGFAARVLESGTRDFMIRGDGKGGYTVIATGQPYHPTNMDEVVAFVKNHRSLMFRDNTGSISAGGQFDGLQQLSEKRSNAVQDSVNKYASKHNLALEKSQF